jgi:hypothetical protein
MTVWAEEGHLWTDLHRLAAPSVEFGLMNPLLALRRLADFSRDARFDEWQGRRHGTTYKAEQPAINIFIRRRIMDHRASCRPSDSEINCRIESFWDGGWTGWLGDEMNGFTLGHVRGETLAECVAELANQACSVYPESTFADRYRTRIIIP